MAVLLGTAMAASVEDEARAAVGRSGVRGGLVVHVGCGDGALTAALRVNERYVVRGLDHDASNVAAARQHIRSRGLYGPVSVERWTIAPHLPYADNLVNLLVVSEGIELPKEEMLRVLAPGGAACVRRGEDWTKTVKPRPAAIDEWTHALYDASNNAVADDSVVAPPQRMQWVGEPRNSRHHERLASISAAVSSGGRLFAITDEAPTASILLPPEWTLVARDAFSGVRLWSRAIPTWEPHLRAFRQGPPELSRRLVAVGQRVYVTLGLQAPVTALDAATGETLTTYGDTEGTEEVLLRDGTLFLVLGDLERLARSSAEAPAKSIVALDAASPTVRWKKDARPLPMSLTVGEGQVFYMTDDAVVALDAATGAEHWQTTRQVAEKRPGWSAPTVVAADGVVLCADRSAGKFSRMDESRGKRIAGWLAKGGYPGELVAYAADTGEELWRALCAEGFHAPVDVFVMDGVVWIGQSRARQGPDFTVGRDLRTGKVVRRIEPDKAFETTMPHHRCYRNRAAGRYIVAGRTGVEFIDVASGRALRHHWIRGTCQYGILPCNGLLYAPPHSCACYIEAKLTGFLALAPDGNGPPADQPPRLERGPAYASAADAESETVNPGDWPTHRHNPARSGCTATAVPAELGALWRAEVGGSLSSPVIADGMALVTSVDRHEVQALDAASGKHLWSFAAGGRIDSPPSVARGLAVFGSADGYVYCLRLVDGALAWRFRAAPDERQIMVRQQLESAWPVHGSVLVRDGSVTCAAGRTSYLDGGIRLVRLDLRTGDLLAERTLYSRDRETGEQPGEPMMFEMPGALPDVLATDGQRLYMRRLAFHPETLEPMESRRHLYSPAGFLNGDWWHRTYWLYGGHFYSGYIGWYFAGRENVAGRLLSVADERIYGFGYKPSFYRGSTGRRYHLFAAPKTQPDPRPPNYRRANRDYPHSGKGKFKVNLAWQTDVPLLARAMVLAGETLFLAGPPDRATRSMLAFEGQRGVMLAAVSAQDGEMLGEYKLPTLPVFDGMAAARGRLYLSLQDGTLLCMGRGKGAAALEPWTRGRTATGKPREPGLVGHWPLDEGAGAICEDTSGLGNDAEIRGRWVRGDFGTCVATRGTPGAVALWDGDYLHFGTGDFSLAFWVKVSGYDCRLLGKENFPQEWWVINVLGNGRAELVLGTGREKSKSVRPTAKTPLAKDGWTHVAFAVNRKDRQVACFINGEKDSETAIPRTLTAGLSVEGRDLRIPSAHKPFAGLFDELRIYKRALADDEVQAIVEEDKAGRLPAAR